jgi:hypothetical protein
LVKEFPLYGPVLTSVHFSFWKFLLAFDSTVILDAEFSGSNDSISYTIAVVVFLL